MAEKIDFGSLSTVLQSDGRVTVAANSRQDADRLGQALQALGVQVRQYGQSLVLHNDSK